MGTAQIQGRLWVKRARDYASIAEPLFLPVYERVFDETGVGMGTRLLDVGCGPGLAVQIAAQHGARVSGLDAAEASLIIAPERTPEGDFRLGEMERLPWSDSSFDVVTSFNAFQFAADPLNALQEARQVLKSGGCIAIVVWGHETVMTTAAVSELLPSTIASGGVSLSARGRVEALLKETQLTPTTSKEVDCPPLNFLTWKLLCVV